MLPKSPKHKFGAGQFMQTPFKRYVRLNDGLDKVLFRIRKSLIFATLNEVFFLKKKVV